MTEMNTTSYLADWSQQTRRVTFVVLGVSWLIVAILFLPLMGPALIALLIVYALYFPTRFLVVRLGWPYGISVAVAFFSLLVVCIGLLLTAGIPLLQSLQAFIGASYGLLQEAIQFLQQYTPEQGWLVNSSGRKIFNLNFILEPLSQIAKGGEVPEEVGGLAVYFATRLFGVAGSVGGGIILIIGVLTLAYFMILELPLAFRWFGNLPSQHRREFAILFNRSINLWNRYLYSMLVVSLIGGIGAFIQLSIMGIGDAVFLSILSTLVYFIPVFGGYIAGVVIFLGAIFNGSSWIQLAPLQLALLAWVIFVLIQGIIIANVIAPKIFGKSVNFPVTLIIFGLVIFTIVGGIIGALLAVPAMGILREIYLFLTCKVRGGDPYPGEEEPTFSTQGFFASGKEG